jgi:hypothetical protein
VGKNMNIYNIYREVRALGQDPRRGLRIAIGHQRAAAKRVRQTNAEGVVGAHLTRLRPF